MTSFTPIASLTGGILIGLSASGLLLLHGRIAGISGILGGLTRPEKGDAGWRLAFVGGLLAGGLVMSWLRPELFRVDVVRSPGALVAAGLLVGIGVRLANGCTSGHGLCGLSRFSTRSLAATITFMAVAAVVVFGVNRLLGGTI